MSRAVTTLAVVLPVVRALVDAVDAADELAHRFGVDPLGAHGQLGSWDVDADVALTRLGLGVTWQHDQARTAVERSRTVLTVHLGPLALTATRNRPATLTAAGLVARAAAADCTVVDDADLELDDLDSAAAEWSTTPLDVDGPLELAAGGTR